MAIADKFSPYLDDEPLADLLEGAGGRAFLAILLSLAINIGLYVLLSSRVDPANEPKEPKPITVEIITFEPSKPDPVPAPIPEPVKQPAAAPVQAKPIPAPKPEPEPIPKPKPIPEPIPEPKPEPIPKPIPEPIPEPKPEPIPEPKPVPKPEPVVAPPPEILTSKAEPEPDLKPETISPPEIEIFEPIEQSELRLEPEPQVDIFDDELAPKAEPTPLPQPAPTLDPFFEPPKDAALDIEPAIDPNLFDDPTPSAPAPVLAEKEIPGFITSDSFTRPDFEKLPDVNATFDDFEILAKPAPITREPKPNPKDIDAPEELAITTTAPKILASPDAPTTPSEVDRAVPNSQAAPLDRLLKDRPRRGGGNQGNIPVGGGSRTPAPGAGGWTLDPNAVTGDGLGQGEGIVYDMRCREKDRTHEDCPEYIQKNKGRDASGREGFGSHAPRGTSTYRNEQQGQGMNMGSSIFQQGTTYGGASAKPGARRVGGPSDDNTGSPSTGVLDDAYQPGFDPSIPIPEQGPPQGRVRDVFKDSPTPWGENPELLIPQKDEPDEIETLILKSGDD